MAERSHCGSRTTLVFRYPLGLVLFVASAAAGVVVPMALHAPLHMPVGEAVFCVTFMALFWGCLGSFFLRAFWLNGITDADKLAFSLGLQRNAPDGFDARRLPSTRMELRTSFVKSSAEGKLFNALAFTAFTAVAAGFLYATRDGFVGEIENVVPWLFVSIVLVFGFGPWIQYVYCMRYPVIWQIDVDQEALSSTRNGTLVERVFRSDVSLVRYDQRASPSNLAEGYPTIKLDMNNGSIHVSNLSRLHFYDNEELLTVLASLWGDESFAPAARFVIWQADNQCRAPKPDLRYFLNA